MSNIILKLTAVSLFTFMSINEASAACPMMNNISGTQIDELIKGNAQMIGDTSYKMQDAGSVQKAIEDTLVEKIQAAREWTVSPPKNLLGIPKDPTKVAVGLIIPKKGPYYPIMGPKMSIFQSFDLLKLEFNPKETKVANGCAFQMNADVKGYQVFSQIITLIPAK